MTPAAVSSATSQPSLTAGFQNLSDQALADWLVERIRAQQPVGYLHGEYVCKVVNLDDPLNPLLPADPKNKSKTPLKRLARSGYLQRLELPIDVLSNASTVDPSWALSSVTSPDEIANLVDGRQVMFGRVSGRGQDISPKTAQKVWAEAGGRCMFSGCGADLTEVPLYSAPARVGYLAHIVASDPRGPRGCQLRSHPLSNNPDNLMLMCDAHHRLIDSFAPDKYPEEVLVAMRVQHRDMVRQYLDSLAYPPIKAVTLHANLAQVPTYFHDSEFIDAILATGQAMLPGVVHHVRRTSQRDDRNSPGFWSNYLREHENQIRQLVTSFNTPSSVDAEELAVFPLHHNATMLLAGRIMGEARAIQVFQYHRERCTWVWDKDALPKPPGTFNVEGLTSDQTTEVLVTIELTARIDAGDLPSELATAVADGQLPWIRITTASPRFNCIEHPSDLNQFMHVARRVINHVQDELRVSKVHLIAISPASPVFRFGQMLQAGHHPAYTIYDRASRDDAFVPAFTISGHDVSALDGSLTTRIPIR